MTLGEIRVSLAAGILAGLVDEIEILTPSGRPAWLEYTYDGAGGCAVLRVRDSLDDCKRKGCTVPTPYAPDRPTVEVAP